MAFEKGHKKIAGRAKGTQNKTTVGLRQIIMDAGDFVGAGGKFVKGRIIPGEDGLRGYLSEIALTRPELYMPLLARVLPLEVTGAGGGPLQHQITGDTTLKEAARVYAQMLKDGSYMASDEEMEELEGFIDESEVKLLNPPKDPPKKNGSGKK